MCRVPKLCPLLGPQGGAPSVTCHGWGGWCLFKKIKTPKSVGPSNFLSLHGSFSWLRSSLLLLTAAFILLKCWPINTGGVRGGTRWHASVFIWRKTLSKNVLPSCPSWFTPSPCGHRALGESRRVACRRRPGGSEHLRAAACPPSPFSPRGLGRSRNMAVLLGHSYRQL